MDNRRNFLKNLGIGVGAGAFALAVPQLVAANVENPVAERFVPGPDLLDRNLIYEFRSGVEFGTRWITANPRADYRPYLVDLWSSQGNGDLLHVLVDKSLELAMGQDTRGWSVDKWNEELLEAHQQAAAKCHVDSLKRVMRPNLDVKDPEVKEFKTIYK